MTFQCIHVFLVHILPSYVDVTIQSNAQFTFFMLFIAVWQFIQLAYTES